MSTRCSRRTVNQWGVGPRRWPEEPGHGEAGPGEKVEHQHLQGEWRSPVGGVTVLISFLPVKIIHSWRRSLNICLQSSSWFSSMAHQWHVIQLRTQWGLLLLVSHVLVTYGTSIIHRHPHTDTYTPTQMHTHTHTQMHTHTHTQMHIHTHTQMHTHNHTQRERGRVRIINWLFISLICFLKLCFVCAHTNSTECNRMVTYHWLSISPVSHSALNRSCLRSWDVGPGQWIWSWSRRLTFSATTSANTSKWSS